MNVFLKSRFNGPFGLLQLVPVELGCLRVPVEQGVPDVDRAEQHLGPNGGKEDGRPSESRVDSGGALLDVGNPPEQFHAGYDPDGEHQPEADEEGAPDALAA